MKLRSILKGIPDVKVKGSQELQISGMCSHSKVVAPGNLFVAKKGRQFNGTDYIQEAIAGGAVAILTDFYNPFLKNVTQILHLHPEKIEGLVAARCYQSPSDQMFLAGVTGTNGKTTVAFWIQHLLDALQGPCGMVGTIEYRVGGQRYQATRTTPDVATNHKLLREMAASNCVSAVMEVTSHALDQGRTDEIHFDVGIFTNLSQDHLDYHQTMEQYAQAKQKLFLSLAQHKKQVPTIARAIINADSPDSRKMVEGCQVSILTYGIDSPATLKATPIELTPSHSLLNLAYEGTTLQTQWPIVGRYNLSNALAACATGLSQGHSLEACADILSHAPPVPGRLQKIPNALGRKIFVDYAHSPDSLEKTLLCLKEIAPARLFLLFGCGGERDRQKRPMMAKIAEASTDRTFLTNDNPRGENPAQIFQEILKGFSGKAEVVIEPDRRKAIEMAIAQMNEEDLLLIAGKGHETEQIFAHHTIAFNDALVAQDVCQTLARAETNLPHPTKL